MIDQPESLTVVCGDTNDSPANGKRDMCWWNGLAWVPVPEHQPVPRLDQLSTELTGTKTLRLLTPPTSEVQAWLLGH